MVVIKCTGYHLLVLRFYHSQRGHFLSFQYLRIEPLDGSTDNYTPKWDFPY